MSACLSTGCLGQVRVKPDTTVRGDGWSYGGSTPRFHNGLWVVSHTLTLHWGCRDGGRGSYLILNRLLQALKHLCWAVAAISVKFACCQERLRRAHTSTDEISLCHNCVVQEALWETLLVNWKGFVEPIMVLVAQARPIVLSPSALLLGCGGCRTIKL